MRRTKAVLAGVVLALTLAVAPAQAAAPEVQRDYFCTLFLVHPNGQVETVRGYTGLTPSALRFLAVPRRDTLGRLVITFCIPASWVSAAGGGSSSAGG